MPAAYPPPAVGFQLSTSVTTPGATITGTGEGFLANSTVTITMNPGGIVLATVAANSGGNFSTPITIPASTAPGSYTIAASGTSATGQPLTASARLTVAAPQAAPLPATPAAPHAASNLPLTGADLRLGLTASLGLILLGSTGVLLSRKRRHARAH